MKTFLVAVFAVALTAAAAIAGPAKLSAEDAAVQVASGDVLLVDIRTPREWRRSGVPAAAHLLDMQDSAFVRDLQALMVANPGKRVAMICATGGRSGFVTQRLFNHGVTGLIDVSEGMYGSAAGPGWLKRGLPVRPADEPMGR